MYSVELANGKKLGLNVVVSGLDARVRVRTAQLQEMVNYILFRDEPKDRRVKGWEMVDSEEEWNAFESKYDVATIPKLPAAVMAKLRL